MHNLHPQVENPHLLSPVALAFVGDAVWEILVRERLLRGGTLPAETLHNHAVALVNAAAQAQVYAVLEPELTPRETDILKRGRNADLRTPKSCSMADYRKATAVEALFGYLYLNGEIDRLQQLYETAQHALNAR
jgi:Uncharacterized protein conserved in bacteria